MNSILYTVIFAAAALALFLLNPALGLKTLRRVLGITLFFELFYILGNYMWKWPFPSPVVLLQIFAIVGLGTGLGALFSKVWPLPPGKGLERIMRTVLLMIPSIGIGIGLQLLMQGAQPTQALYLIFALASWLGSGLNTRKPA